VLPPLVLYNQGEYEAAADELHRLIELRPGDLWSYWLLAYLQTARGRYADAIAASDRVSELDSGNPFSPILSARVYAAAGRADEALAILAAMEKLRGDPAWPEATSGMAEAYAALGDHDRAFELLDEAIAANAESWAPRSDPSLDPLRGDPRFDTFLERVGLDDASVDSIMVRYRAGAE
jgi:tetratricopeptide (TPR) repeat protein